MRRASAVIAAVAAIAISIAAGLAHWADSGRSGLCSKLKVHRPADADLDSPDACTTPTVVRVAPPVVWKGIEIAPMRVQPLPFDEVVRVWTCESLH